MIYDLPKEVLEGLNKARKEDYSKKNRLRVMVGDVVFPVLRYWEGGFSLDVKVAPKLRGLVDLYDGANHFAQCLIVLSSVKGGERIFEFKRHTQVVEEAPIDFEKRNDSPVALISSA